MMFFFKLMGLIPLPTYVTPYACPKMRTLQHWLAKRYLPNTQYVYEIDTVGQEEEVKGDGYKEEENDGGDEQEKEQVEVKGDDGGDRDKEQEEDAEDG
ncbi:unnamed protein product [Caretta caretta]